MSQIENKPEAQNGVEAKGSDEKPLHYLPEEQDAILSGLVSQANSGGVWPSITLFVKGAVITGHLISGRRYYELFGEVMDKLVSQASKNPSSGAIAKMYKEAGEKKYPIASEDDELDNQPDPGYIHLEQAQYVSGSGAFIPVKGYFWRGRLNQVDGFMLGGLSSNPPE